MSTPSRSRSTIAALALLLPLLRLAGAIDWPWWLALGPLLGLAAVASITAGASAVADILRDLEPGYDE